MRKTASVLGASVVLLIGLGIVILASSSSVRAFHRFSDPGFFVKRQVIWLALALPVVIVAARLDYRRWRMFAIPLTVLTLLLLAAVLIPGVGARVGGSRRWLHLGPIGFQPSELAKFSAIVAISAWLTHCGRRVTRLREGILIPVGILGAFCGLIILEPDFGATFVIGAVGAALLFAGGARLSHLTVMGAGGLTLFGLAVLQDPVRLGRIMAFVAPEKYPVTAYHLAQSKVAFIRGGFPGLGLGKSIQKQFYLPEAHTDFILAIVGEELGFLATAGVVLLFLSVLACGTIVSFKAPDPFGKLLAFGLTVMIAMQAGVNVGVVTGCLPTKGLALPFISYGGSSLLMSMACVGVLLSIARQAERAGQDSRGQPIRDSLHRV